jgi:hypothetical protein
MVRLKSSGVCEFPLCAYIFARHGYHFVFDIFLHFAAFTRPKLSKEGKDRVLQALHHKDHHYTNFIQLELLVFHYFGPEPNQKVLSLKLSNQRSKYPRPYIYIYIYIYIFWMRERTYVGFMLFLFS